MEKRLSEMNYEETGVVKKIEPGLIDTLTQLSDSNVSCGKDFPAYNNYP